jgi:hypothetical protein
VRYTGRIERAAFCRWCDTPDGRPVIERIASHMRFSVFGRLRAARRRVWRQLIDTARADGLVVALQREVDGYLTRLNTLVHAHELPRVGVDLYRLVAVPRLFANAALDRRIDASLDRQPAFATANGREPLRDWFIVTLIDRIEAAVVEARPSPKQPLPAGNDWIIVGVNDQFEWRVPFSGPAWPGHYYLFERTRTPITRAVRKSVSAAIAEMEASLPSLSRVHRDEILRKAGSSLDQLFARA